MIDFTHKTTKDMLNYLKKQCLSLTNTENIEQLRETELMWNPEEYIAMYFTKLHKENERLKKLALTRMNNKKSHRHSKKFTPVNCLARKR